MEENRIVYLKGNRLNGFYKKVTKVDCINCALNFICVVRTRYNDCDYCRIPNIAIRGRKEGMEYYWEKLGIKTRWSGDCPEYIYAIKEEGEVDAIDNPQTFVGIVVDYLPKVIEIEEPKKKEEINLPEEVDTMDNSNLELTKEELSEKIISAISEGYTIQILNNDKVICTIGPNTFIGKYCLKK